MLTAVEGTRFYQGLQYFKPAIYNTRHVFWHSGTVPDGPPRIRDQNAAALDMEGTAGGIFCAGIPNLFLTAVGKRVPTRGNPLFDGGVAAYFGDNKFGPGYFEGSMEPFDLQKAKQWAADTHSGVLLGRRFVWTSTGQVASQGHVAILMPSGYVLQAFPFHSGGSGRDTNWDYTIEDSHDGFYWEVMVHPRNWINYDGDEF